jgi:O-antigen ligase
VAEAGVSWEAVVVAVCLPPIFLHVRWQPGFAVSFGHTELNAYLSDFAVAAIVLVGLVAGIRRGFAPLAAAPWIWASSAALLAWIVAEVGYGHIRSAAYPWHVHAATAGKFVEYALLAPALPLALRRKSDLLGPLWALSLWSGVASIVGLAEFFGASIFVFGRVGGRQGSFLSEADFAALSGAVLLVGIVALLLPQLGLGRALGTTAVVAGVIGVVLAAAVASLLGLATAGAALGFVLLRGRRLAPRRLAAAALVALVAVVGVLALRGGDVGSFARFVGSSSSSPQAKEKTVQTYAHRTLLSWIGLQIWKDHPILGVGWEASGDPSVFDRYLPAAHRHFPDEPALAFPSASHAYGVQDVWIQALSDLGIIGLGLLIAMFASVIAVGVRVARTAGNAAALIGLAWTALVVWLWAAQSFVAGIPLDAVTWLGFGLVATGAALARKHA